MASSAHLQEDFRIEPRVPAALHVRVSLTEDFSNSELVCTYDISRKGGRLGVPRTLSAGKPTLWIARKGRKARFRIAWVGAAHTVQAGQIGVERLEANTCIWDDELQKQF